MRSPALCGGSARLGGALRRIATLLACPLASWLVACSTLPAPAPRAPSFATTGDAATPLGAIARAALPADDRSGFMLQPYGPNAFATRIELTRLATRSLDVQYYLLLGDNTGRALMRGLRDAAARGVRVRLLVDDLYTAGEDDLLLGLASYPNVEVRLFNPFPAGRASQLTRFVSSGLDFARVNRRMHNKLFIADNAAAVAGGRNMADEYVLNASGRNFIDMDAFVVGPAVRALSAEFDHYWNSEVVYPVQQIAHSARGAADLQAAFETSTAAARPPAAYELPPDGRPLHPDPGDPDVVATELVPMINLPFELARGRVPPLLWARARVLYDPLTKTAGENERLNSIEGTVTGSVIDWFETAQTSIRMVSPYFIPGDDSVASLARAHADGLSVELVTNSLASTDEPWAYFGYSEHLLALLKAGVEVHEISPSLTVKRRKLGIFGKRTAALHMKGAIVDHRSVFLGSMNLDPRSALLNTELGLIIDSPAMAGQLESLGDAQSAYDLRLNAAGTRIEWVERGEQGQATVFSAPPETTAWQRFWLRVTGPFIPQSDL